MLRLVLVLVMVAAAYSTNVQQCTGSDGVLPWSVVVKGCEEPPCDFPQNQDAVIHYTFPAPRDLPSMRSVATVYLNMGGMELPIVYNLGPEADTCSNLKGAGCPVAAGQLVHYTLRMPIYSYLLVGDLAVNLELKIESEGGALVCSRIPVRIVQ